MAAAPLPVADAIAALLPTLLCQRGVALCLSSPGLSICCCFTVEEEGQEVEVLHINKEINKSQQGPLSLCDLSNSPDSSFLQITIAQQDQRVGCQRNDPWSYHGHRRLLSSIYAAAAAQQCPLSGRGRRRYSWGSNGSCLRHVQFDDIHIYVHRGHVLLGGNSCRR